ncbi:MAG: hypothetical protein NPIRA02_26010 [Nitrospirales bacterium]|nr:MAG: hypothetical protein NPIRA02_26010 [Nitrospirales bacterium]
MPEEPNQNIDLVMAELFQPEWYRREELCTQLGIGDDLLEVCLRWEVVHVTTTDREGQDLFESEALERLSRGLRLHRDLGINWAGVVVALDLLERIEDLERNLHQSHDI